MVEEGAPRPSRDPATVDCSPTAPRQPLVEEGAPRPSRNPQAIDLGTPGASARREFERRQTKREARIREKHPKHPRCPRNLDHIAVTPTGVSSVARFTTRGVQVLWPKKLYPRLAASAQHQYDVAALHKSVADILPTA